MMKRLTFRALPWALLMGAIAVSCAETREMDASSPEQGIPAPQTDSVTFSAYLEAGSKTQLGDGAQVLWSASDRIRVFNAATPQGVEFQLMAGEGTQKGTFRGPALGEGPYYAVYPAEAAGKLTGNALAVTLPVTQKYAVASFGAGANLAAGKAEALGDIHFFNLLGSLAITLTGDKTVTDIRIRSNAGEPLHGDAVIGGWDLTVPTLTLEDGQTDEPFRDVVLDCGAGVQLSAEGTVFHVVVPAGTLADGYWIEVYDSDGQAMVKYAKAAEDNRVDRGEIVQMPSLAYTPGYKADFLLSEDVGIFTNTAASGQMASLCTYVEGQSQYAYLNKAGGNGTRYLRLEDWDCGYAIGFTMPYTLTPGKNAAVTLEAVGLSSVSSGTIGQMHVVKVADGKVWMQDPDTGNGFILMMVEE